MNVFRGLIQWVRYERPGSVTVVIHYKSGDTQRREFRRERWIEAWDDAHAWCKYMHERMGHRITYSIM